MKRIHILTITLLLFFTISLSTVFSEDYTRWELPEGAKLRLGKGSLETNAYNAEQNSYWFSEDSRQLTVVSSIGIWKYDVRTGAELKLLPGPTKKSRYVTVSPDGKTLVSANFDNEGNIKLWDAESGELIKQLIGHTKSVTSISFGPNVNVLASGSTDQTVRLWNIETGSHKTIPIDNKSWTKVRISPDGQTLASESDNEVSLWNTETGVPITSFKVPEKGVIIAISFSPDGQVFAVRQYRNIHLWDTSTGELKSSLRNSTSPHAPIPFSPDGGIIACAAFRSINLYDVDTGEKIRSLTRNRNGINSITFSPDGNIIAGTSWGELHLWDRHTGEHKATLRGDDHFNHLMFSPNGQHLVAHGEANIYMWNIDKNNIQNSELGYVINGQNPAVYSVAFNRKGETIASAHHFEQIRLWNSGNGQLSSICKGHPYPLNPQSVMFSPDGKTLASLNINTQSSGGYAQILFWDASSGEYQELYKGHGKMIGKGISYHPHSIAYSGDGKMLVSGSLDGMVRLWRTNTLNKAGFNKLTSVFSGNRLGTLKGHTDQILSIALSPDDKILASGSLDETIRLWDVGAKKHIRTLTKHNSPVKCVSFSPDGKVLASVDEMGFVYVWDSHNFEPKAIPKVDSIISSYINSLIFSPDGRTLAIGGNGICLWDMNSNKIVVTFKSQTGAVKSIQFSPDGSLLASGYSDGTVLIWEVPFQ